MYYSIESRAPFLSKNLFDFRNTLRKNFLIRDGIAKFILRDAFKKEIPSKIINNKEKTGFYLPLDETLNFRSKKIQNLILNNSVTKKYLKRDVIKKKINDETLSHQDEKFLFVLLNISLFLKHYKR